MLRTNTPVRTAVSRLAALAAAGIFTFTAAALAAQSSDSSSPQPEAIVATRITQPINPDQRVTLAHNVHPLAKPQFDQGAALGSTATGRIMLVLKRSAAQENALKQYLGDLQNPNSPNYHKWITPAQFGKQYGISDTDLATVTAWLQSQGFTVDKVPQARNVIEFSGNFAQIQQAFHTTIHRYMIHGEQHFANATDPQIPAALAPVVAGIANLNDFHPKSYAKKGKSVRYDPETKTLKPYLTDTSGPFLYVGPADAATIYDAPNSALNKAYSGTTYDGTGVTIGIVGDSNIDPKDLANYRSFFGLSGNAPNVIISGNDPGINGDAIEALLDNEVAGALAPGAKINFYTAGDTDFQSGLFLAIYRALDDNAVSILNVSFGGCELAQGASGNEQILEAWEQAAAQGISVTVSSGDSGSAICDDPNTEDQAQNGLAVNGLGSTPYNISVGGTDYDILGTTIANFSNYVNATSLGSSPYFGTALKYIPENPWNGSTASNFATASNPNTSGNTPYQDPNNNNETNISGAGGGQSSAALCSTDINGNCINGTYSGYPKPAFQTGLTGNDGVRDLPDVSFLASPGDWGATWAVCEDANISGHPVPYDCVAASDGSFYLSGVGGTSAAAPAFAGMLAVISQSQGGVRLGQVNNVLYNLAAQQAIYSTAFHDVTKGNNSVYCLSGTPNCSTNSAGSTFLSASSSLGGYDAKTGYDLASGLGSLDIAQIIANWKNTNFTPTTTTLTINGPTSAINVQHGTSLTFSVNVSPSTATGDVSIINDSGVTSGGTLPGFLTLNNGSASGTSADLPGSSTPYNVYAYYGGDVKDAPSKSATGIQVNITPEPSQTIIGAYIYDPIQGPNATLCDDFSQNGPSCNGVKAPYGYVTAVSSGPEWASQSNTVPTGTINLTDSAGPLTYNGTSASSINVPVASNGIASYNNYQNQNQSLSVASHSLTAKYSGDGSYGASTSSAFPLTISQGQTSVAAAGSESGTTVTLTAQVNTDSIGLAPTGTVTFAVGSTTLGTVQTAKETGFVSNGSNNGETVASLYELDIPASTAGLVNGANTIKVTYAGDANYAGSSGSANVTITGGGGGNANFSISGTALTLSRGATSGNTSTVTITPANGFTGAVSLSCKVTSTPTGAIQPPTCSIPASVTVSGASAVTTTLTVTTSAPSSSSSLAYPLKNVFTAVGGSALACVLIFTIPARRKSWRAILGLIVFAIAISSVIGCGGGSSNSGGGGSVGGTTTGSYVITVTGTSGSTSASGTVAVTVTN